MATTLKNALNSGRVFVIAEAGSCHDQQYDKAVRLIKAAAGAGADAVKFQFWSSARRMAERRGAPELEDAYHRHALSETWLPALAQEAEQAGVDFMCSTYLPEDVDVVAPFVDTFKVSSFESADPVHLSAHARHLSRGKNVVVSLGLGHTPGAAQYYLLPDMTGTGNRGALVYLLCVSAYPAHPRTLGLARLRALAAGSQWPHTGYGFSDHSEGDETRTGTVAAAVGAVVIERHICLHDTDPQNPDRPHAMVPRLFYDYVDGVRLATLTLGVDAAATRAMAAEAERPVARYDVARNDETTGVN